MSGHFICIVIIILVFTQSYVRFRFAPRVRSFPPSVVFLLSVCFPFFVTFPLLVVYLLSISFLFFDTFLLSVVFLLSISLPFFVTFPLSVVFLLSISFLFFVTFPLSVVFLLWYRRSLFDVPIAYDCHVGT